ncbi:MAG: histidine phosphatase family protein [Lachnospiraceae bacterium]
MELYIVRHGQTVWNKERKLQGSTDIMLNEEGIRLAKLTGEGLKNIFFDKIYSSPLKRAYDTACYIRGDRNIPIVKDERIRELCFGDLEGRNMDEMSADKSSHFQHFFDEPQLYVPDERGETLESIRRRGADFLKTEIEEHEKEYERVMIVAHGAMNKALLSHIRKNDIKDFWGGAVQRNCSAIIIKLENGIYEILEEGKVFYS